MSLTSFVSLSLLLAHYAAAASVPSTTLMPACSKTSCQYTIPADVGGASSGTLKLWGPEGAIADVSRTAGWETLECNETEEAFAQEIRMVCADPNSGNCDDLYHVTGAAGKVVRLPLSCGKNAFARVISERPCANQTLPSHMTGLKGPSGTQPQIMRIQLDTNFAAANASAGPVRFAITGANVPGLDNVQLTDPTTTIVNSRHFQQRGFFDWVQDLIDQIKDLNNFDSSVTKELPPLNIDQQFNLLDEHVSCGALDAGLKIDVGAKANAVLSLGVVASGTIVPPKVDEFMIISSLTADLNGELDIVANVAGSVASGEVTLFQAALPGLDFPGILTIGPTFQLNAEATAQLDIDMDISVGINYHIDKAQFTFPPTNNSGAFDIGKTPLTLSAAPTVNATGTLEAHLLPKLNLGITALGNVATATVFLALDASAGMQLGLNTGAATTVRVTQNDDPAKDAIVAATASAIADVGGCMDITAGLDVNLGADAKFFDIFDVNKQVSLFSQDYDLFQKCFGASTSGSASTRRSSLERRQTVGSVLNLLCPAATSKVNTVSILSGSVDPTEVKA